MRRHPLGSACVLAVVIGASSACDDIPVAPQPAGPNGAPRAAVASVPGASQRVLVTVPPSMRFGAFGVDRYLTVPTDFRVAVYARVDGARFMAVAPNGDLLVSTPNTGKILLVRPGANGADPVVSDWATGLYRPHDIVFHAIDATTYVYVAEGDRIARYTYTAGDVVGRGRQVLISGLPSASTPELGGAYGHELKNIALDASHRLYVSIASTCNACASDTRSTPVRGAIYVYNADGSGGRLYARGIRNAEGLAVVPGTNTLWAAVNNRDDVAYPFHADFGNDGSGDDYGKVFSQYVDDHPPEEFIRVRDGGNYGWPFCNPNPDTPAGMDNMPFDRDVQLNADGSALDCATADRVTKGIQAHSAPLGLTFFKGTSAPATYRNGAAIALHGSWNRQRKTGYKVVFMPWDDAADAPGTQADLVTGWASDFDQWGRPVDVAVDGAGAILVSDDFSGTIYKLTYAPPAPPPPTTSGQPLVGRASGKCLDVAAAQTAGSRLVISPCAGGASQSYQFPASGATGDLRVYGTMCVQPEGGSSAIGSYAVIGACQGAASERWTRTAASEMRSANGLCLDVQGAIATTGTPIILWSCHGGDNQKWDPSTAAPPPPPPPAPPPPPPPPTTTSVSLVGRASGMCLDVSGASRAQGAVMIVWWCNGGDNQHFTLPAVGATGEVRVYGSMCLDLADAQGGAGDRLVIATCAGLPRQQWTRTSAGELRGLNARCADVYGALTAAGTAVILWDCHGGDNQKWDARG